MRSLLFILLSLASTVTSHAVITMTGTSVSGLGPLNAPVNSLVILLVDIDNDGFLGKSSWSGDLVLSDDPGLNPQINISVGGTFGGDVVSARGAVTTAGALTGAFTIDNTSTLQGKNFALVWFSALTTSNTSAIAGAKYGITRGTDWVLPAVNGGESFSFSATDASGAASFFRVTVASNVATNDTFTTSSGPIFTVVPETSTSLLAVLGVFGLLRRRR